VGGRSYLLFVIYNYLLFQLFTIYYLAVIAPAGSAPLFQAYLFIIIMAIHYLLFIIYYLCNGGLMT